ETSSTRTDPQEVACIKLWLFYESTQWETNPFRSNCSVILKKEKQKDTRQLLHLFRFHRFFNVIILHIDSLQSIMKTLISTSVFPYSPSTEITMTLKVQEQLVLSNQSVISNSRRYF